VLALTEKRGVAPPLIASALVTAVVGAGALLLPKKHIATFVAFVFLAATWRLVWTKDDDRVRAYGLQLGGLLLHEPIRWASLLRDGARAAGWALGLSVIIFGPYYLGWRYWWNPHHTFSLDFHPLEMANDALGQLLLVALPEEAFYRGYLQTRLDEALPRRVRVLGADIGPGLLVASTIFAIGHFVTVPLPARLAVFFPSLVFGWLRARTGGIGAPLAFHAFCNIFSETLGRAYGVY
jgi:membrane protease YdiL (CAAX protease family)